MPDEPPHLLLPFPSQLVSAFGGLFWPRYYPSSHLSPACSAPGTTLPPKTTYCYRFVIETRLASPRMARRPSLAGVRLAKGRSKMVKIPDSQLPLF